jgi:hypothetical protein
VEDILHGSNFKVKAIDEDVGLVGSYHCVGGVLWILLSVDLVVPSNDTEGELCHSGVNWLAVVDVPDHESIVFSNSSEEAIVRTEGH